jgi:hypothetical protein
MDTLDSKALGIEAFDPPRHASDTKLYTLQEDPESEGGFKLLDVQDDYAIACASPWLYVVKVQDQTLPQENKAQETPEKSASLLSGVRAFISKLFRRASEKAADSKQGSWVTIDENAVFIGGPGEGGGGLVAYDQFAPPTAGDITAEREKLVGEYEHCKDEIANAHTLIDEMRHEFRGYSGSRDVIRTESARIADLEKERQELRKRIEILDQTSEALGLQRGTDPDMPLEKRSEEEINAWFAAQGMQRPDPNAPYPRMTGTNPSGPRAINGTVPWHFRNFPNYPSSVSRSGKEVPDVETEEVAMQDTKAGQWQAQPNQGEKNFVTLEDGRVIFIGGPGQGGGGASGGGNSTASLAVSDGVNKVSKEVDKEAMALFRGVESGKTTLQDLDRGMSGIYKRLDSLRSAVDITDDDRRKLDQARANVREIHYTAASMAGVPAGAQESIDLTSFNDRWRSGKELSSFAFAFKATDGTDWWMQWTTNGFEDREKEIFTTKSLEDYVERHRGQKDKGEFWYRHIPGTKFGTVQWQAMVGRFLAQAGPFDSTPVGQAFKEFFGAHPDGHPVVAPQGWGTSHGYYYNAEDRKDRIYDWLEIRESTVLPAHVAANPWSPAPKILTRSRKAMSPQDEKDLREIGGDALVDLVKRQGEGRTKTLEPHVAHKEITDPIEQVQAVADVIGGDLKAVLLNAVKLLTEGKAKKAKPKKEEEETEVPEEFAEFMVEGTEDAEAEAVVEEEEEEPKAKAKAKAKKQVAAPQAPPQPVAEVKAEPSEAQITRAEIVDAMKEMGAQIRDEVIAATSESLKTLLTPFADEIAALKRADGEKIAEKAMQTPAASLTDLLRSARTRTEAAVKEGDPLLDRKPVEVAAQQNPAIAGMPPLIGAFITGADLRKS